MPRETFDMTTLSFAAFWAYATERAACFPEYAAALPIAAERYHAAHRRALRFNRRTWTTRDNRLGVLSRPASASDFPDMATPEDAIHELCREIWCDAVRVYNVRRAA